MAHKQTSKPVHSDLLAAIQSDEFRSHRLTPDKKYVAFESDGWVKAFVTKPHINACGYAEGKNGEYGQLCAGPDNTGLLAGATPFWYRICWYNGKPIRASQNYYK